MRRLGLTTILLVSSSGCLPLSQPPITVDRYDALQNNQGFIQVVTGNGAACATDQDGLTSCWGEELQDQGPFEVPDQELVYLESSLGPEATFCGITTANRLECWGRSDAPKSLVLASPTDQPEWFDLAVGDQHACALDDHGQLYCWGDDGQGQLDVPDAAFLMVDAAGDLSCGLDAALQVRCWGGGEAIPLWIENAVGTTAWDLILGQSYLCLGEPDDDLWYYTCFTEETPQGSVLPAMGLVDESTGGDHHLCVLHDRHVVSCSGDDSQDQLAIQDEDVPWIHVSAGVGATCGVHGVGSIYCYGDIPGPQEGTP